MLGLGLRCRNRGCCFHRHGRAWRASHRPSSLAFALALLLLDVHFGLYGGPSRHILEDFFRWQILAKFNESRVVVHGCRVVLDLFTRLRSARINFCVESLFLGFVP